LVAQKKETNIKGDLIMTNNTQVISCGVNNCINNLEGNCEKIHIMIYCTGECYDFVDSNKGEEV
jgi:hypothetical protein